MRSIKIKQLIVPIISLLLLIIFFNVSAQEKTSRSSATKRPDTIEPITAPFDMPQLKKPVFPNRTFNIVDYDAVNDGKTKNTEAFNKAIEACSNAGGGKVLVPAGKWVTGAIHLKSNVNLHFEEGAELHFSEASDDYLPVVLTRWAGLEVYNYSALIYAYGCENIAITGPGKLYGHGESWWHWKKRGEYTAKFVYENQVLKNIPTEKRIYGTPVAGLRPQFINPVNCKNVLFEGFQIAQPGPFWTFDITYCENVIVRGLQIDTYGGKNTDGININSTKNALVEYCSINSGDDCVALKSGINEDGWRIGLPTQNVVIRNIQGLKAHGGIVIGSDMSGDIRNIYAYNCKFTGTDKVIRLKSNASRGGTVENIWYNNIEMNDIEGEAIIINTNYGAYMASDNGSAYPVFRNIKFSNITCKNAGVALNVKGTKNSPVENITLENIKIKAEAGMKFDWVNGIEFNKVKITPQYGDTILFTNCKSISGYSLQMPGVKSNNVNEENFITDIDITGKIKNENPDYQNIFYNSGKNGLTGEYYNNKNLEGKPVHVRIDKQINFNWEYGSPANGVNNDRFSARWSGQLKAPGNGKYDIGMKSDNGFRLFLNNIIAIDAWNSHEAGSYKGKAVRLEKDKLYDIKIEFFENVGTCSAIFNLEKYKIKPEIPAVYYQTDINKLISINSESDALRKRDELINFIFGDDELPFNKEPEILTENYIDSAYCDIEMLKSITKMEVKMEYGLKSVIYHFNPKNKKNKVVLYHQGHRGDFISGKSLIKEFLNNGYSVLAFAMPLMGMNNQPVVNDPDLGQIHLTQHEHLKFLNPENGHPVKYFVEPVITAINYLEKNFNFKEIEMVGISGGGWTTTLAAAIDTRIKMSFPVAGSYPVYLRSGSDKDWGDWEQTIPELLRTANFLELYILGAYGNNRKQVQIVNKYDACCYGGTKWKTYFPEVSNCVEKLNKGKWDLWLDDTHKEHKISKYILQNILSEILK
ncbi:MAG: glycosyl hydrolase family 28 protein [Bacteroidota bacterium]